MASIYLGSGSSAHSTRVKGAAVASAWTLTLPLTVGTASYVLNTDGSGVSNWAPRANDNASNYSIASSVATNAMTVTLNDAGGAAPSSTSVVDLITRSATATTGTPLVSRLTSALSIVIPSGATLGLNSATDQYIYVYFIQNTSSEIGVCGVPLDEGKLISATAITSGSTSVNTLYATSNHTTRPIKFLGRIQSNQTVSGTYGSAATEIASIPTPPPIMSAFQPYTPTHTGFGTPTNVAYFWRRVGDSVEVKGYFTCGTSTATEARVTLPSGLSPDTKKLTASVELAGTAVISANGANQYYILIEAAQTYFTFSAPSAGTSGLSKQNGSAFISSGNNFSFRALVPISGWDVNR